MLRIRSTRLLSGASAIAILTALAAGGAAEAAQIFQGPLVTPPITNAQPDSDQIINAATVDHNTGSNPSQTAASTNNDSFFNNLTMSSAAFNLDIENSNVTGDVENTGSMTATGGNSIFIGKSSQIDGRLFNSGNVTGSLSGVVLEVDSTIRDGFFNTGTIVGTAADAFRIDTRSELLDGLLNTGTMTGGTNGLNFAEANVQVFGGIENRAGVITASGTTGGGAGINWAGNLLSGGIKNSGTVQGLVNADGIRVSAGEVAGDLNNSGLITGTGTGRAAFHMTGGTFDNNLVNTGTIDGATTADGIFISAGVFTGKIDNQTAGTIHALNNMAIHITGGTFSGGIANAGHITADVNTAILITGGTFSGGINNTSSGQIYSGNQYGIFISNGAFNGNIQNDGTISSERDGIHAYATTFTGSIVNTGLVDGRDFDAIDVGGTLFTGSITNSSTGTLIGSFGSDGIRITATTLDGSVTNNGSISASGDGINLAVGSTVTGNVSNGGTITAGATGIQIDGTVNGTVTNTGLIDPLVGIKVTGTVTGGIHNSDSIIGTLTGIDLTGETGTTDVTQTNGLLRGNSIEDGSGTVAVALNMNNGHANTFNANGGVLDGNVVANNTDNMLMNPTDENIPFVWLRGTGSNLNEFDVNSGGEFGVILGAAFRGDTAGVGVLVGANEMTNFGNVYIDNHTQINLVNGYTGGEGVAEFYLTSNTLVHGQIAAATVDAQAANIRAFVNGTSFGSVGGDTFVYANVFTGTTNGTDGDIQTNSLFFEGKAIFHPAAVDIELDRLSFADALVLPGMTQNETSIANTLDNIYALGTGIGGYGPDFEDLFNFLLSLGAGDEAQALAIYNELSGAEHAQLQQTTLDILNPFNTFMGDRLDSAKAGMSGVGFASIHQYQYAQASAVMTDASQGTLRGSSGIAIWGRGYGQRLTVDGDPEAPGYDQDTAGGVGGIDFAINNNGILGFAAGWSNTDVKFKTPGDKANVDSFQVGGYGSWGLGRFYLDAEAAGAFHSLSTTRFLNLPNPPGGMVAGADYDASSFSASGEFGAVFRSGKWIFQPNAGVLFTDAHTESFIELGAGDFNLIVNDSDAQSLASSVGLRLATQFMAGRTPIMPEFSAAWRHEFDDDRQTFSAAFADDPSSVFNIISSKISPDSAVLGAGVSAGLSENFEVFLNYNGLLNQDVDVHNGSAGFRATW